MNRNETFLIYNKCRIQGVENILVVLHVACSLLCRSLRVLHIVKLREREGQRVDSGRSLKGHLKMVWWMVDILSLMLYIKFGCHPPTFHRKSLNLQN